MNESELEKVGIINEVGDLGLGFFEIDEEDQKKIEENDKTAI